jgi:two-component system, sensor histidine kinase YesM
MMLSVIKSRIFSLIQFNFKYKLFLIYFAVISLPLISFGIISYNMAAASVESDFIKYKENLNTQIIGKIDENVNNLIRQSSSAFMMLDDMNLMLGTPLSQADTEYYDADKRIIHYILGVLSGNELINGVALIGMDGNVKISWDRDGFGVISGIAQQSKWFENAISLKSAPLLRETHLNEFYDTNTTPGNLKNPNVISVCRSVRYFGETSGVLIFDETLDNFVKTALNVETEPGEILIVFGRDGNVIYSNSKLQNQHYGNVWSQIRFQKQGSLKYVLEQRKMLVNYSTSKISGWQVVSLLPVTQLQKRSEFLKNINITLFAILVIFILIISVFVSYLITIPLKKLMASFEILQRGDFSASVEVRGKDEFAQIGLTFNQMVSEIRGLITQKYELGILKKQAELEALQSQINPHFLFNTLYSIREVVMNGNIETSSIMLQSLSDVFRYSLNRGQYEVKFSDELDHLKKYLYIQKCRFGDKYNIVYDIDSQVLNYGILRLTLQPVVENALYHGLDVKRGNGELIITAKAFMGKYTVYVWDNGAGIAENELDKINTLLESNPDTQNYLAADKLGIYNVNARIKFHYGNEFGLKIYSTFGSDTTVKITLPAKANI